MSCLGEIMISCSNWIRQNMISRVILIRVQCTMTQYVGRVYIYIYMFKFRKHRSRDRERTLDAVVCGILTNWTMSSSFSVAATAVTTSRRAPRPWGAGPSLQSGLGPDVRRLGGPGPT